MTPRAMMAGALSPGRATHTRQVIDKVLSTGPPGWRLQFAQD